MSLLERGVTYAKRGLKLFNTTGNDIINIGVDDIDSNVDEKSVDWSDKLPCLVKPTIINIRLCEQYNSIVHGILEDLVIKSISGYSIQGDNEDAVSFIEEQCERWNLDNLLQDWAMNNCIDGFMYQNIYIKDNLIYLRELAIDGKNYKMKELYDDDGVELIGYKQIVKKNVNTNKDWMKSRFDQLTPNMDTLEFNFTPDEVLATTFFRRHNKPKGLVENVLDEAYMYNLLQEMMLQIVYKQANTMIITVGNKDVKNIKLDEKDSAGLAMSASNYHRHGVQVFPYGVDAKLVGDTVLPKIQDYLERLEHSIFVGLFTPEAVYSSSSSNRSTAVVQLDSDKSGRVLVQEYLQHHLTLTVNRLFNLQLELSKYPVDSVWIEFESDKEVEEDPTQDEDLINVTTTTGTNQDNIHNGEGRLGEVQS